MVNAPTDVPDFDTGVGISLAMHMNEWGEQVQRYPQYVFYLDLEEFNLA
jgi:hypothetical protein